MSNKSKYDEQIISHILSNQGKERGIQNYACYELLNCEFSVIEKKKFKKELHYKPKMVDSLLQQNSQFVDTLRILTGKKHPKMKLQRLRKIRIWTFESLVQQINSF